MQTRDTEKAEEACARALAKFPNHPLFKSALAETGKQKTEAAAESIAQIQQRVEAEPNAQKQAAILGDALRRYPDEPSLLAKLAGANAVQSALDERIEKARSFETKRLFGEAIKEWEAIGRDYPWLAAVAGEAERLGNARRKEKQDSQERWFRQVDEAIDAGDFESAGTMLRQAAQQQPDRQLQTLDAKLKEGLKRKEASDAKFAQRQRFAGRW